MVKGRKLGPITTELLEAMARNGSLRPNDGVWCDDLPVGISGQQVIERVTAKESANESLVDALRAMINQEEVAPDVLPTAPEEEQPTQRVSPHFCPHCGTYLGTGGQLVDMNATCPDCNKVTIKPPEAPDESESGRRRDTVLLCVSVLVLIVFVIVLWLLL